MAFNPLKTRTWDRTTPNDGTFLEAEYNQLYENDNYLKTEIDKLDGASKSIDGTLAANSDNNLPTEKAVKTYIDNAIKAVIPVGFIYLQLPGTNSPSEIFGGTWENVSSDYAGDFFRAEGGTFATVFNSGRQSWALQHHGHRVYGSWGGGTTYNNALDRTPATGTIAQAPYVRVREAIGDGTHPFPNLSNETRPVNQTIRVWKKIVL